MNASPDTTAVIAILGGSGAEGGGLAVRWARAGYDVVIGSRTPEKAQEAAAKLTALTGRTLRGMANAEAAAAADIVVLAVPYAAQKATADDVAALLKGKILIDVTVPLVPPKVSRVQLPGGGSAVQALQDHLGAEVRVVSAFQNVSAHHLLDLDHAVDCDVLVCSDDEAARVQVVQLATDAGMRAWEAGPLANSAAAEAMTSLLIWMNRRYKVPGTGVKITGLDT